MLNFTLESLMKEYSESNKSNASSIIERIDMEVGTLDDVDDSHDGYEILNEFIDEVSGLNAYVPDQYRSAVKEKAWQFGHSAGYVEYWSFLSDLVDIFRK